MNVAPLPVNAGTVTIHFLHRRRQQNQRRKVHVQLTSNGSTTGSISTTSNSPRSQRSHRSSERHATQAVRSVDSRWFGCNTAIWDITSTRRRHFSVQRNWSNHFEVSGRFHIRYLPLAIQLRGGSTCRGGPRGLPTLLTSPPT